MPGKPALRYKVAREGWELAAVNRLNYQTFVEEIPQHPVNADGRLVDRFHAENTYLIGLDGRQLVAMAAVRDRRPFSLDAKLSDLDAHLPPHEKVVEVRLLSVEPAWRDGRVFAGLLQFLGEHCLQGGYDLAVISGTTRQEKLYRHLGFQPFGPLVGSAGAWFQPMYLTREAFLRRVHRVLGRGPAFPEPGDGADPPAQGGP